MAKTRIEIPYEGPMDAEDVELDYRGTYSDLLDCPDIASSKSSLLKSIERFEKEEALLKRAIQKAHTVFQNQPVLTAFLLWSKQTRVGLGSDCAKILLEHQLIPFKNKNNELILIKDLEQYQLLYFLETIRCRTEFSIVLRELLVMNFVRFFQWLSKTIGSSYWKIEDPDEKKTRSRILAHETFIALIDRLDDRCRLVAKLLYFGGSRTLDQVLKLKLEDVVFDKQVIRFGTQIITYPRHVFLDIATLTDGRRSGPLFSGRQDSTLNPATVFRNFKEAASQIGLGDSFSPKTLTTDC